MKQWPQSGVSSRTPLQAPSGTTRTADLRRIKQLTGHREVPLSWRTFCSADPGQRNPGSCIRDEQSCTRILDDDASAPYTFAKARLAARGAAAAVERCA